MLYLLHGENKIKAREKAVELIESLRLKKPDASYQKIETDDFSNDLLEELISGQGLFENKKIVYFDSVCENKEFKEFVLSKLARIAESENILIFLEGKLDKASLTKFEKKAKKVQVFKDGGEKEFKNEFNIFSLTDAFGRRDRKTLWTLYVKALSVGKSAEEVHGILFWQLKSIFLAKEMNNAEDAGMASFAYSKAKSFSSFFKKDELLNFSKDMVAVYNDARTGNIEFEIGLEQFILSV